MTEDLTAELRRRAARLAAPPDDGASVDTLEALGFGWDGAEYLVAVAHLREAVSITGVAAVPGARPPLLGMATVRSEAVPVIDLRPLLELPAAPRAVPAVVVLSSGGRASIALAADDLRRLLTLRVVDLHAAPEGPTVAEAVTADGATLLDADLLLDLPPFFRTTEGIVR